MMVYAGFQLLEVSCPMDVFQEANRVCGAAFYEQHVVGPRPGPVMCSNGTAVGTTACLRDLQTPFDIVMVPGSPAMGSEREHRELVDWLTNAGRSARKIASVSNGAFLVARAGLANHRWLTTRERDAQRLASDYPLVHVVSSRRRSRRQHRRRRRESTIASRLLKRSVHRERALPAAFRFLLMLRRCGGPDEFSFGP
jgi:transcriptional regulator GlxA family with amidase domain